MTMSALKHGVNMGRIQRIERNAYVVGAEPITGEERAAATVIASGGAACSSFAARLYELDSVRLRPPYCSHPKRLQSGRTGARVATLDESAVVEIKGLRCAGIVQCLFQLAPLVNDAVWEQMLESALRKRLTTIDEITASIQKGRRGVRRVRRVLELRPNNAPPTESLLETFAIQLLRINASLPVPIRQLEIFNRYDIFQARVDLAFPNEGVFFELDGQQHQDQPVYDANRQTRVVAATGWLVGRFTWDEITLHPKSTLRRMAELFDAAKQREYRLRDAI